MKECIVDNKQVEELYSQTVGSTRPFFRFMTAGYDYDYDEKFVTPSMYVSDGVINRF